MLNHTEKESQVKCVALWDTVFPAVSSVGYCILAVVKDVQVHLNKLECREKVHFFL